MEITQQVRDYAAKLAEKEQVSSSEAIDLAREQGMAEMSEKFSRRAAARFMWTGTIKSAPDPKRMRPLCNVTMLPP